MFGGGFTKSVGAVAKVQTFKPLSTTPDINPNAIVDSADNSNSEFVAVLQAPGAYPLAHQAAIWDCGPVRDVFGSSGDGADPAAGMVRIMLSTTIVSPADTYVGCIVADGTPGSYTKALGILIRSNGTGYEVAGTRSSGTFTVQGASGAHNASGRKAFMQASPYHVAVDQIAGKAAILTDENGDPLLAGGDGANFVLGTATRIWVVAGWVAGTGSAPATVRITPKLWMMSAADMIVAGA